MSIVRSPVQQASGSNPDQMSKCIICNEVMTSEQDCLVISHCEHSFHRSCIEDILSQSSECPICKRPCQLSELRKANFQPTQNFSYPNQSPPRQNDTIAQQNTKSNANPLRGRARGAGAKRHHTRSFSKSLFQEANRSQLVDFSSGDQGAVGQEAEGLSTPAGPAPANTVNFGNSPIVQTPQRVDFVSQNIDYSQIHQIIESSITRILGNLNLNINPRPPPSHIPLGSHPPQTSFYNSANLNLNPNNPTPNLDSRTNLNNRTYLNNATPNNFENFSFRTDKITSIIQNWGNKFNGSANGLNVEEFLYISRSLTADNFGNEFSPICKNFHILLSGKARDWFWRYHKQVENIVWEDFCAAIRYQYKEFKSDFDIKEEIRARKQKPGESFEVFYESIVGHLDRLGTAMSEQELIEILSRNLRPDIRHELLYVPIYSLAHLRKLVQMRENLLGEENYRRSTAPRPQTYLPRRNVAEIELVNKDLDHSIDDFNVNGIQKPKVPLCWNCNDPGHHWEDCVKERSIFCYGCGAKNTYKPNCEKCSKRSKNYYPPNLPKDRE
ncbi:hypothetical protein CVS40_7348 [Lucilia cuprina]|nr:hypothetical protein CVS40_7348 [Lucilia cuprina]